MTYYQIIYSDELYHHGIKGQKWGIRRYQNEDGTLTPDGRRRYGSLEGHARRASASLYGLKEKAYKKLGYKEKAKSSREAKNRQIKLANKADQKNLENYNSDGSRKYSPETIKKINKNKTPLNAAERALNIATLGSYRGIKSAEMRYRAASERDRDNVTGFRLAVGSAQRYISSKSARTAVQWTKTAAAMGASLAYTASGGNPTVKTAAMTVGKIMNTAGDLSVAAIDAYNIYGQARDTIKYVNNKRGR